MIELIIGVIVSLFVAFFYGRSTGKQQDTKEKIETVEKTKDVESKIEKMPDNVVRNHATKWVRNKNS